MPKQFYKNIAYIACILLLIAIAPLPYGYYTFLRIVVTIVAIVVSIQLINSNNYNFGVLMIAVAILFNPLIPIYLEKEVWIFIDSITALMMFLSAKKM